MEPSVPLNSMLDYADNLSRGWASMRNWHLCKSLIAGIFFGGGLAGPSGADPVSDFYKGRDLRLIISSTVGGGYDVYARTIARHLSRHIPGNPNVVPQNMPGAGGIAAANHVYAIAPKDGSVIAAIQNTVPFEPFFENKAALFDANKLAWLGTPTTEVGM